MRIYLTCAFGLFMILAGIAHFATPTVFYGLIPDFLPKELVNMAAGVVEIAVGVSVFIPATRQFGTLMILLMMLAFLPLHVLDVFKETPAVGSFATALVRLPLQFVLIYWAWYIHKK